MKQKSKKLKTSEDVRTAKVSSKFECVVGDDLTEEIPLVDVYVGIIPNKKLIRDVILELNHLFPVTELQHLKRVNENKIIICLCDNKKEEDVFQLLENIGFKMSLLSRQLEKHKVLQFAPKSRAQFMRGNNYWPTNFHENKYIEDLLANSIFTIEEVTLHEKWMRVALEAAKRSVDKNGSVIVDPINNEILSVGSGASYDHPIKHSVMVAIDLISHSQGGGVWDVHSADYFKCNVLENVKTPDDAPYLCTGYYVYTIHEPCMMCAMALIHSRVKRVFYAVPSSNGALGTLLKIHTIKNLNHHYEVFRGFLKEEISLHSPQ